MLARTPWTPTPTAKAWKLKREQRERLIGLMANILRSGEPTPFRFEAVCRHAVRAAFCLSGGSWQLSDAIATDIVCSALERIGAQLPPWQQGQPDYAQFGVIMRITCMNCGSELIGDIDAKFCGAPCRRRWHSSMVRTWLRQDGDAYQSAVRRARGLNDQITV